MDAAFLDVTIPRDTLFEQKPIQDERALTRECQAIVGSRMS